MKKDSMNAVFMIARKPETLMFLFLRTILSVLIALGLCGCTSSHKFPITPGGGYIPLDPLPVSINPPDAIMLSILNGLPDETMRLATEQLSGNGNITYGPASVGIVGSNYNIVIDYVKCNEAPLPLAIDGTGAFRTPGPNTPADITIPVYVGIGIRMTANLTVVQGNVSLGNLVSIGAAADAKRVVGTLVVQTLGISGESVSSAMPVPTELSGTSIQSALMALGQIKGKIYSASTIRPRVVGFLSDVNDPAKVTQLRNKVISSLLEHPLQLDLSPGSAKLAPK